VIGRKMGRESWWKKIDTGETWGWGT